MLSQKSFILTRMSWLWIKLDLFDSIRWKNKSSSLKGLKPSICIVTAAARCGQPFIHENTKLPSRWPWNRFGHCAIGQFGLRSSNFGISRWFHGLSIVPFGSELSFWYFTHSRYVNVHYLRPIYPETFLLWATKDTLVIVSMSNLTPGELKIVL